MLENNLKYQIERSLELKKKLLDVFSNFDKEGIANLTTKYTVRGGYEITREAFDAYLKMKAEQINKIYKDFEGHKIPPTKK